MCWLVHKPAGKVIPADYITRAASFNKDGFGIARIKDGVLNVFKTLDLTEFTTELSTLDNVECIIHLRAASIGGVALSNVHPFETASGVMFHNGTISSFRGKTDKCALTGCEDSDTKALADLIASCRYERLSDIQPLIQHIITTTSNKLAFMEKDGTVIIMNKNLGEEEDTIWYSNDYHKTPTYTYNSWQSKYSYNKEQITKVFVYGTLKSGHSNNRLLEYSTFVGKGSSLGLMYMIGKGMGFPYVLGKSYDFPHTKAVAKAINGEVYEVTETTLAALDALEGCPSHYTRETCYVRIKETGKIEECYIYVKSSVTESHLAQEMITEWPVIDSTSKRIEKYIKEVDTMEFFTQEELELKSLPTLQDIFDECSELFYGETEPDYLVPKTEKALIEAILGLYADIRDEYTSLCV